MPGNDLANIGNPVTVDGSPEGADAHAGSGHVTTTKQKSKRQLLGSESFRDRGTAGDNAEPGGEDARPRDNSVHGGSGSSTNSSLPHLRRSPLFIQVRYSLFSLDCAVGVVAHAFS